MFQKKCIVLVTAALLQTNNFTEAAHLPSFEDVREDVSHSLIQPLVSLRLSRQDNVFKDHHSNEYHENYAHKMFLKVSIDSKLTAFINATVAENLLAPGYHETYYFNDGSYKKRSPAAKLRRYAIIVVAVQV